MTNCVWTKDGWGQNRENKHKDTSKIQVRGNCGLYQGSRDGDDKKFYESGYFLNTGQREFDAL